MNREQATDAFKEKYGSTYTSKYNTEPSTRPDYIPKNTTYNNQSYTIIYNQPHRGYGYYVGSKWYYYNVMMDTMMLDSLMHRHHYYGYPMGYTEVEGWGFATVLILVLVLVVFIVIFAKIASRD